MNTLLATSSFYEILLIVLVIILISNGMLRRRNLQEEYSDSKTRDNKIKENKKIDESEYVDYEIIND